MVKITTADVAQYQTQTIYDISQDAWIVVTDFTDYKIKGAYNSVYSLRFNIPQGCTKLQLADILEQQIIKLRND